MNAQWAIIRQIVGVSSFYLSDLIKKLHKSSKKKKAAGAVKRRKPGVERRAEITNVAAELFADKGFSVGTRDISSRLGITQAALYKHFQSKDELIEEVFRNRYLDNRPSNFKEILTADGAPLDARLSDD